MKFKLKDTIYDASAIDKLTLKMGLQLQEESAAMGRRITLGELEDMSKALEAAPAAEQKNHPNAMWLTAISVWAARKLAGESVTFAEAVDFPLSDLTVLPDPKDHLPPKPRKSAPRKAGTARGKSAAAQ